MDYDHDVIVSATKDFLIGLEDVMPEKYRNREKEDGSVILAALLGIMSTCDDVELSFDQLVHQARECYFKQGLK